VIFLSFEFEREVILIVLGLNIWAVPSEWPINV
jgi:hypothetical protein